MSKVHIEADKIKEFLGIEDSNVEVDESTKLQRMASRLSDIDREMTELEGNEFNDVMDGLSEILNTGGAQEFADDMNKAIELLKEQNLLTKEMSKELVKDTLKQVKKITSGTKTEEETQEIIEALDQEGEAYKKFREQNEGKLGAVNEEVDVDSSTESKVKAPLKKMKTSYRKVEAPVSEVLETMEDINIKESFSAYNKYISGDVEGVDYVDVNAFLSGSAPTTNEELQHSSRWHEALKLSNKLVRDIRDMKAHNVEDKTTGLQKGKLNRRQLYRVDKKVFMRKDSPQKEEADLSIYMALDHSGSTHRGLDRQISTVGLAMADALEKLHIQHHIFLYHGEVAPVTEGNSRGHSKYILAGPTAGDGGNDEYNAMMHTIGVSEKDWHRHKILIIVTDGDGSGDASGLKEIRRHRPDMRVLVVGLNYDGGSFNKSRAEGIYGKNNVIVVKSQDGFSKALTDLIKKEVLK